jgi:indoleamine 2,3-dioxygenase
MSNSETLGASAGQSPLIHALDVGLSVKHQKLPDSGLNPMLEMRDYLSQKHRNFLNELSVRKPLCNHILDSNNVSWLNSYNQVLEELKRFRDTHIQLTTIYIIEQSIKDRSGSPSRESFVGTGGTDLVKFLKQSRNETKNAKI